MKISRLNIILIITVFCNLLSVNATEITPPKVDAQGAIIMDYESGRVLWEKNSDAPLPMASTTKIMTAIVALENSTLEENVVVSKKAAGTAPVKMNLKEGEEIKMENLLYALMMQSSNDAAVAIAEHIGGTVDNFCDMMTSKAVELGCRDTVFRTPNGLDSEGHHSTAYDMAVIAKYALDNSEFVRIINTKNVKFDTNKSSYNILNKNRLIYEYEGAMGIKTGYTGKAGHCFVGAAKQEDMTLITVVLASGWGNKGKSQKWIDTKTILNYGFKNYKYEDIIEKGTVYGNIKLTKGKSDFVDITSIQSLKLPVRMDETIEIRADYPLELDAPIKKGQEVGLLNVYINNEKVSEVKLISSGTVLRRDFKMSIKEIINSWLRLAA